MKYHNIFWYVLKIIIVLVISLIFVATCTFGIKIVKRYDYSLSFKS